MKKTALLILLVVIQLAANAQKRYELNTKKSKLEWKISTMGNHYGYLLFSSGILDYSVTGEPMAGTFTMDMNSIRSTDGRAPKDIERVNKEIKKPEFFDVKKYPTALMKVKRILRTSKPDLFKVNGNLTIRGITKPIVFMATIKETAGLLGILADITIDRTEWNIHHIPKPKTSDLFTVMKDKLIQNEIKIKLNLSFKK